MIYATLQFHVTREINCWWYNPKLCHQDSESVVVSVHSTPEHTRMRTVLRETWATLLPTYIGKVKFFSFLGAVNNELLRRAGYIL